jgi:hypothetical protein
MVALTREHVEHLANRNQALAQRNHSLAERLDALKQKLSGAMTSTAERLTRPGNGAHLVRSLEVNGAALVGGFMQGHAGPDGLHIGPIPVDAGAGAVLAALGYFGVAGKYSEHLINVGDGLLSSWSSGAGFHMGNNLRTTGKLFGPGKDAPALAAGPTPPAVKGEISPQQMADIVARVRGAAAMRS